MQKGRVSDRVAMKRLKSLLTTVIHGKEARGKSWLLTRSRQGLIKGGGKNKSLVYHKRGHRRVLSKSKADKKKIKGEEARFSFGSSGGM